jgi:multisubunit Na+/H+ antiporter MnhF subunit
MSLYLGSFWLVLIYVILLLFFVFLCLSFIYVFVGDPIASRFIIGDHNVFLVSCIMLLIEIMQECFFKLCFTIDF